MTAHQAPHTEADYVDLSSLLRSLIEKKGMIIATTLIVFIFAMTYALFKPTQYQGNLLLQIQQQHSHLGAFSKSDQSSDLEKTDEEPLSVQVALIRSKFILNSVIHTVKWEKTGFPKKMTESEMMNKILSHLIITDLSNSTGNNTNKIGLFQITLTGTHPAWITDVLNAIAITVQQKNIERKLLRVDKNLTFLKKQLPIVRKSLQQSEIELNHYRLTSGKIDISLQTHYLMTRLSDIDKQMQALRLKKTYLLEQYTGEYPFVLSINEKMRALEIERSHTYQELKELPASDQMADAINRDIRVKNNLYMALLNQLHELEVEKNDMTSDIRILVAAKTPDRIAPIKWNVVSIISLFTGFLLGCLLALGRKIVSRRLEDHHWIEKTWHIKNLAVVPHGKNESLESLYHLRTYLQLHHAQHSIITLMGFTKNVGKTFIATQLAHLLARIQSNVLLIDADLREGHLHRYFNRASSPGLAEILSGASTIENAIIQSAECPSLFFLPTGKITDHPTDLLASPAFKTLLKKCSREYTFILINATHCGFLSDCTLLSSVSDLNFLVLRMHQHSVSDIHSTMKRIQKMGLSIHGSIFNQPNARKKWYQRHLSHGFNLPFSQRINYENAFDTTSGQSAPH